MKEIFDKQFELNEVVFATQKLTPWGVIVAKEHCLPNMDLQSLWVENMRKALSSEFSELLEEIMAYD